MNSDIGDFIAPFYGLILDIGQILECSKGPEVMPDIVDGAFFHLAFFLGLPGMAGFGNDLKGPQEVQKTIIKADQRAISLCDGGKHVVMDKFPGGTAKKYKGV